jgi:hypothetical protein
VLTDKGDLVVPPDFSPLLSPAQKVRVILLFDGKPPREDRDWDHLTARQFLEGYSEKDAIYDRQ